MLAGGEVDNSLEQVFGQVERDLPISLAALDDASTRKETDLPEEVYKNICWYCAFLHTLSPYFKAKAPIDFLDDLNRQLLDEHGDLLDTYLAMPKDEILRLKSEILNGKRVIFKSDNYLQLLHRIQFKRVCKEMYYQLFRGFTKWTVSISPINLPISDIAILEIPTEKAMMYGLPISPSLLLLGYAPKGLNTVNIQSKIYGETMTLEMARTWVELVCLSAQVTLASKIIIPDVLEQRKRATEKGHRFNNVKRAESIIKSGIKDFSGGFSFHVVTNDEYLQFRMAHLS